MVRTRIKGNGMKAAASPNTEPDFYAMTICYEKNDDTNKIILDNEDDGMEEFEPMVSGETTADEVDCLGMEQDDREPYGVASYAFSSIITPDSSPHSRKSNTAVLEKLEWPSGLSAPFGEAWLASDNDGMLPQPRLNLMNQPSIQKKTPSEALSLAFMMSKPPMMIEALHQSDVDDEDSVLLPHSEDDCSVIGEGDEVIFEGHELRYLDEQGADRVFKHHADAEQKQQHLEDMISARRFGFM